MADIRINSLPSTATSFNSDDYIAIDGTSGGTRKMLAANPPFNDVILGSSGPSVKSTLSARAPRQGLVFDGTAQTTSFTIPAFGTRAATVHAWVKADSFTGSPRIVSASDTTIQWLIDGTTFVPQLYTPGGSIYGTALTAGKFYALTWVINGDGTAVIYTNGIAGTSGSITANLSSAIDQIGRINTDGYFTGFIAPLIYNRALSSSEVVALYEAGAPARYDYNPSTNAAVPSGGTYAKWFGTGTVSSGTASSFTVDAGASSLYVRNINRYSTAVIGAQYKIDLTITGTITGIVGFEGVGNGTSVALAGTGSYVITGTAAGAVNPVFECTSVAGGTITITGITALGLLLAPDAYQAGGGLSWYDTSGNSATITLPASGVSWNVPSSGYWGGQLKLQNTTGTNGLRINNISSDTFAFLGGGNDGLPIFSSLNNATIGSATYGWLAFNSSATGDFELYRRNNSTTNTAALIVTRGSGNLLLGTTTDNGLGKFQVAGQAQVQGLVATGNLSTLSASSIHLDSNSGTNRILATGVDNVTRGTLNFVQCGSAGGSYLTSLGFDTSGNATFAGDVTINKSTPIYALSVSGARKGFLYFNGTDIILGSDTGSVGLSANSGVVFVSSGQAFKLGNAYVAGAPSATGYVTIQDSTGTTYKVLVST